MRGETMEAKASVQDAISDIALEYTRYNTCPAETYMPESARDKACLGNPDITCDKCHRYAADKLAGEILDKLRPHLVEDTGRLMPEGVEWPRFEDGEPVRFGDVVSDGYETGRVHYVTFDTVNPVIIGFTDETPDQDPGTWLEVSVNDGERVKRPAPKVLDADGAEIHVGDTVCGTRDMEPMRVVDTDSRECGFKRIKCEKEDDGFFFYCADELTHKLPVIAADGKPLREGEHVYHVETGAELVVKELPKPGEYQAVVVFALPASHLTSFDPDQLTHERPESWERLEDDATMPAATYCERMGIEVEEGYSFVEPMARDLVRRAKKLAGVER